MSQIFNESPQNSDMQFNHEDFYTKDEVTNPIFLDPVIGQTVTRYIDEINNIHEEFVNQFIAGQEGTYSSVDIRYKVIVKSIDYGIVEVGLSIKFNLSHSRTNYTRDLNFVNSIETIYGQLYGSLMYFLMQQLRADCHLLNVNASNPDFAKSINTDRDTCDGYTEEAVESYFVGDTFFKIYLGFGSFN